MEVYLKKIKSVLKFNKHISDFFLKFITVKDLRKKPDDSVIRLQEIKTFDIDLSNYTITSNPYWKSFSKLTSDPLFYAEIPNVKIISKGIVITSEKEVVLESTIFQLEYLNELYSNHLVVFNKLLPYRKENKVLSLLNRLDNNYYHWTMESLSRILLVFELPVFKAYQILIKEGGSKFMFDSLQFLFEIPEEKISTKPLLKNVKADKTMVVSFPHIRNDKTELTNVYYPSLVRKLNKLAHRRLHENRDKTKQDTPKYIVISRKNALERRIINEGEFMDRLKGFDFVPVRLEELSYVEQVTLFYNVKIVIATHGAGISNIIYGKNPLLIELFPRERTIRDAFYFAQITSALKFRHEVIEYDSCNHQQDVIIDNEMFQQIGNIVKG